MTFIFKKIQSRYNIDIIEARTCCVHYSITLRCHAHIFSLSPLDNAMRGDATDI